VVALFADALAYLAIRIFPKYLYDGFSDCYAKETRGND